MFFLKKWQTENNKHTLHSPFHMWKEEIQKLGNFVFAQYVNLRRFAQQKSMDKNPNWNSALKLMLGVLSMGDFRSTKQMMVDEAKQGIFSWISLDENVVCVFSSKQYTEKIIEWTCPITMVCFVLDFVAQESKIGVANVYSHVKYRHQPTGFPPNVCMFHVTGDLPPKFEANSLWQPETHRCGKKTYICIYMIWCESLCLGKLW